MYQPNCWYYVDGVKKKLGYRIIIDNAREGKTLEVWGDPKSKKEMVYVKDFVQMVQCCVNSSLDGGIYNLGCGHPISIEDQIKTIAEVFAPSHHSEIVYRPEKPSSPQFVLSIEKAQRELGYEPKYSFLAMMEDFKLEMENEPFAKLWGYGVDYA